MDFENYFNVLTDLQRIIDNEYKAADSERNHQTFAAALKLILEQTFMA